MKFNDCGLTVGANQEDLEPYSLKSFDLQAQQPSQQQPDPEPIPAPSEPSVFTPPAMEQSFSPPPSPVQTEWSPPAPETIDVHFGQHFTLLQPLYTPFSQSEPWKMPRWVIATVGLFFGSAAVFAVATCVVLLRDPKPAPTEPLAVPTAAVAVTAPIAVAATSPAPARPTISAPITKAPGVVHNNAALPHRVVASRQPTVVRRQFHGPRRVASRSTSSSEALQETETVSRRPPQDALDKLLGESSLAGAP